MTGELRKDLQLFPGEMDTSGHCHWTVHDPVSGRYFRFNEQRHRILSLLDRNYEIDEFLAKLEINGVRINRVALMTILGFLRNNGLMLPEYGETEQRLNRTVMMKKQMIFSMILSSYLFFRLPLVKPDRFLDATCDTVRKVFNRWMLLVLSLLAIGGYLALIVNWNRLTEELMNSISLEGLLRYSLAVILIKCVHEFAHAYVAKAHGIRVRRMGVAFIVFFPRLYTDLTDAWRIANLRKRFIIDAAGILAETVIGGLAALVWVNSGPGSPHTIAYYIFAVSIINTVLVNGNPFIRYDGYYMLMDMVGIDNLQRRGSEMCRAIFHRFLFGMRQNVESFPVAWKNHFVVFYGIASFVYRIFLYTSIILIVYFQFTKTIGIILLMLEVWLLILKPLITEIKSLMAHKQQIQRRNLMLTYAILAVILLPLLAPLPWMIASPCEIRSASAAIIYVQNSGRIKRVAVKDGDTVKTGCMLFQLESPEIDWQYRQAVLQRESLRTEIDQLQSDAETLGPVKVKRQQLQIVANLIEELGRRRQLLDIASPLDGVVALADPDLQAGKMVTKGEMLAEVYNPDKLRVIAYVKEENIDSIRPGDHAEITLEHVMAAIPGKVIAVNPIPADGLPPSPLLSLFGGILPARKAESQGFELLAPYYQVVIEPETDAMLRCGATGTARIRKYSSVGWTLLRKGLTILYQELSF